MSNHHNTTTEAHEREVAGLREALRLLLSNWPPERDGMDYEVLPIGVAAARAALRASSKGGEDG